MRVVIFCHSLISDWNHGNAHFLRGVAAELVARGHRVDAYEPEDAWSLRNLVAEQGGAPIADFHRAFPQLDVHRYRPADIDLEQELDGADLEIVHEWNDPEVVARVGRQRARMRFRLLFHDTHHRGVTEPDAVSAYDLSHYDGVLAFGAVLRDLYVRRGWAQRAWTWHEAADVRVFRPLPAEKTGDLVWIGNWGDEERSAELHEFLLEPVRELKLAGTVHGVRYPKAALAELRRCGLQFAGWISNYRVPAVFARFKVTVHVPRRLYAGALPGIPTIRPFEALACGIPLVSAPWDDVEGLFRPGQDFLVARDGGEMRQHLRTLLDDPDTATALAENGLRTIHARHTCAHRVDELLAIVESLSPRAVVA